MGNESSCRKSSASAAADPPRMSCASIVTVSPSPYGNDSPTSPEKCGSTLYGVADKWGGGVLSNCRVERWHALVRPARMDMDRFVRQRLKVRFISRNDLDQAVCVREDGDAKSIMAAGVFDGHGISGSQTWGSDIAEAAAKAICRACFDDKGLLSKPSQAAPSNGAYARK